MLQHCSIELGRRSKLRCPFQSIVRGNECIVQGIAAGHNDQSSKYSSRVVLRPVRGGKVKVYFLSPCNTNRAANIVCAQLDMNDGSWICNYYLRTYEGNKVPSYKGMKVHVNGAFFLKKIK